MSKSFPYRGDGISDLNNRDAWSIVMNDLRSILLTNFAEILRRIERDPSYSFIETKLSLRDGADFPDDDPLRGKRTIYSWIQGRGLEALATFHQWLESGAVFSAAEKIELQRRVRDALSRVTRQMETLRVSLGGNLPFMMTARGAPLAMSDAGDVVPGRLPPGDVASVSDLFYVKGLLAAASVLNESGLQKAAGDLLESVLNDIHADRIRLDQEPMDPKNPVRAVPGRRSHGPRMIGISAATWGMQTSGDVRFEEQGIAFIQHILRFHVKSVDGIGNPAVQPFEMWEFIDDAGKPMLEEARLRSDSGHATEFVGLAMQHLRTCERVRPQSSPDRDRRFKQLREQLANVLRRGVANGFSPQGHGIIKAFDLIGRKPMNTDMPWWPLTETMRAAAECATIASAESRQPFLEIFQRCCNAFFRHFVRRDVHLMAVQCLDHNGDVAAAIPATPDADPGYHTGISLMDCLDVLD